MNLAALLLCLLAIGSSEIWAAPVPATAQVSKPKKSPRKAAPKRRKPSKAVSKAPKASREASGIQAARPGTLLAMAIGVLEKNSLSDQQALEAFAQRHRGDVDGVLAHMVLGYHAYLGGHYPEAKKAFEAARLVPSPIQDYVGYYLAMSELGEGDHDAASKLLDDFAEKNHSSPFAEPATLKQAELLLSSDHAAEAIALLLSPPVSLSESAASLLLGEAYHKDHQPVKAAEFFQKVYYLYSTSPQAYHAEQELRQLRQELGESYPAPSEEMRKTRAERLFAASQWKEAESEYRGLATLASGSSGTRDHSRVRIGVCQYGAGNSQAALATLNGMEVSDPEADAERIYTIAASYRRLDQPQTMQEQVQLLGQKHPESSWYEKALFMTGNHFLVSQDLAGAAQYYAMVYEQFPQGQLAAESHWRVAWRRYRERNLPEARRLFEEHIRNYPSSQQISASIYWLGRTLEPESPADAAPYYRKLVQTFPNYYYGLEARQRLAKLPKVPAKVDSATSSPEDFLGQIRRPVPDSALDGKLSASDQERRNRAKLLESAWLIDLAVGELRAGIIKDSFNFSLGRELAHLEVERGRYNVALEYGKRFLGGYFAFDLSDLPREDWELLFPLPWWGQMKQKAEAMQIDPYLVAGLIRQESEFNPEARSRSNALGLMQLLPATARRMAKQIPDDQARSFRLASLTLPELNMAYGTFYLRLLLKQFNGSLEEAVAAYNAGENRVAEWLQGATFEEPAEFVESIPFTETREYVQAVLRNAALYHKLYLDGQETEKTGVRSQKSE